MAFDRSRFKGAKMSANKDSQKDAQENNKSFGNSDGRAGFLTIDEGKNVFRILPPHPEDKIQAAYLPKRVTTLECEVPVWENGEITDRTEIKRKNIYIATQHGGLPKDPVELYIEYVRKYANDAIDNKEDRTTFLYPITGWKDKKGWNWGINPKTSFVSYATKDGKLGRLELYESMIKDMDKCAISEEAPDVMSVDPFSDPDEGCELIITKQHKMDKKGNPTSSWEYIITKGAPSQVKKEGWNEYFERTAVSETILMELEKQEPLSKMMGKDVYTKRDWDFAIDGLTRFDIENKFGIFDNEEFIDELDALEKLVPENKANDADIEKAFPDKKKEEPSKLRVTPEEKESPTKAGMRESMKAAKEKVTEKEPVQESKPEEDDDTVSPIEMKITLKRYVKKEFGEDFVSQIPTDNKGLAQWYALLEEGEDLPIKTKKELKAEADKANVKESIDKATEKESDTAVDNEGGVNEAELSDEIKKLMDRRRNRK